MDWKKVKELEDSGLINLVPSVTEIAKVADGFGAFGNGAKWGREMTVEAYEELLCRAPIEAGAPSVMVLENAAKAKMDAPKEAGSELHDLFHRIRIGEVKDATPQQQGFYATCCEALLAFTGKGPTDDGIFTEMPFTTDEYGGTPDVTIHMRQPNPERNEVRAVGMDWKTVKKPRPPRMSELLQIGAYAHALRWEAARIVYISQDTLRVVGVEEFDESRLTQCYWTFHTALTLARELEQLGLVEQ